MSTPGALALQPELAPRYGRTAPRFAHPWALALAVALPLAALYLIVQPPAGDLAAATYRSALFARVGFATWDTGWYAAHGHFLPGYSLLSPVLGWLLGVRVLLVVSGVAASALFALIARRAFGPTAARIAAALFALGFCVELLSGRVPYDMGFAIGLGAVLTLMRGWLAPALCLAAISSVASPVAGAFLALAGLACALGAIPLNVRAAAKPEREPAERERERIAMRGSRHGLALAAAALAPIAVLELIFPESGYEPFAPLDFWLTLCGALLIALLLPQGPLSARGRRIVRVGAALYALALIGSFALQTPVGGNAARLGPPLAAPLLAGVMWERRRAALLLIAPALICWQLVTPILDIGAVAGDPSVQASYYAPVLSELGKLSRGAPAIVEVPLTEAHWEAAYLAGHDGISLARGWERQLDTRYGAIFYRPTLTPSAYRAWLAENSVSYVALPDTPLDEAGVGEGGLVACGLPYLHELWHARHWRLYRFMG
jgi:hypothetical protein